MVKVVQPRPVDTSAVRDPGMVSLITLAGSLGWNVLFKPNNPVVLTARDGTSLRLPTNTSIRISVFQSRLSAIMTHTDVEEFEPTPELIEAIITRTKVDRDHARRLRLAVGVDPSEHRRRTEPIPAGKPKEPQPVTQRIEVPTPIGVEPHVVSREPRISTYDTGAMFRSATTNVVTYSDGTVKHECSWCNEEFPIGKNIGGHYGQHRLRDGAPEAIPVYIGYNAEAAKAGNAKRKKRKAPTEPVKPMEPVSFGPVVTEEPIRQLTAQDLGYPAFDSAEDKLNAIRELLGRDDELEQRIERLEKENEELRLRNEALQGNLAALRDLLSGDL